MTYTLVVNTKEPIYLLQSCFRYSLAQSEVTIDSLVVFVVHLVVTTHIYERPDPSNKLISRQWVLESNTSKTDAVIGVPSRIYIGVRSSNHYS